MKIAIVLLVNVILLMGFSIDTDAQEKVKYPNNSKAKKHFNKGVKYFKTGDYANALKYFDKTILKEPEFIKSYIYKASINYKNKNFKECENNYKNALKIDSLYDADIYYSLAIVLEDQMKLEEALTNYLKFLNSSEKNGRLEKKAKIKIKNIPFRIVALKNPVPFDPVIVGENINTPHLEYLPALTGDNHNMIFTRRINHQEDFFISSFENNKWQQAKPIIELNTRNNEGAHSISPDGRKMFFTVCDRSRTFGSCDLVVSEKRKGKWSKPLNLGKTINSTYWESQPSISSDGKTLYFVSDRPGCKGGKDIWYTQLDINNKWSFPICLDTTINTIFDDMAPYIHSDNKTLYFTSNGHPGMGGTDLFLSRKINNNWTKAKNLGYPINTQNNEGALFVTLDGKKAFFSSDRKENKNLDIYYFNVPDNIKPDMVTYIKGIVLDQESEKPLKANIVLYNNETGETVINLRTDLDTFFLALPYGIDYNLTVEQTGYAFYSDAFKLKESNTKINPFTLNISLSKILKHGENSESPPIVLNNIFFKSNSYELDTLLSKIELGNLLSLLKNNEGLNLKIIGHTDNVGDDFYNLDLSEKRAKSVYEFLINNNVGSLRLSFKGMGETIPIDTNETKEGRRKNRRTEFVILY